MGTLWAAESSLWLGNGADGEHRQNETLGVGGALGRVHVRNLSWWPMGANNDFKGDVDDVDVDVGLWQRG